MATPANCSLCRRVRKPCAHAVRSWSVIRCIHRVRLSPKAIGHRIGAGPVKVIHDISEMNRIEPGDVLVTDMTDPDWEPIMKKASAIVTNRGGRTCHAAIIARELGIPAVVGCGDATERMKDGENVTVSCAEGDTGYVYAELLEFSVKSSSVETMPDLPLKVMMNVGNRTVLSTSPACRTKAWALRVWNLSSTV